MDRDGYARLALKENTNNSLIDCLQLIGGTMTVRSKILEALQEGPATSTELAAKTEEMRGNVKVALVAMVRCGLVSREKIVREGRGPKSAYCYQKRSDNEILSTE